MTTSPENFKGGGIWNVIVGINDALKAKELIKVKLLDTCPETVNEVALEISMGTKADVVHIIGHTIIFFKSSEKGIYKI